MGPPMADRIVRAATPCSARLIELVISSCSASRGASASDSASGVLGGGAAPSAVCTPAAAARGRGVEPRLRLPPAAWRPLFSPQSGVRPGEADGAASAVFTPAGEEAGGVADEAGEAGAEEGSQGEPFSRNPRVRVRVGVGVGVRARVRVRVRMSPSQH